MIAIIDYNMGNLASVSNAFAKIGKKADIIKKPVQLSRYDKVILPGVGAFGDAMEHLEAFGFIDALKEHVDKQKALLGICLGMQLLFDSSSEFGHTEGLGCIPGQIVHFSLTEQKLKVPHMGWNVLQKQKDSKLLLSLPEHLYLYFVHSYHVQCADEFVIGKTQYGYDFPSAVQKENIFGFQPHPEKSHDIGLKILKNFTEL